MPSRPSLDILRQTAYALSLASDEGEVGWITVRAAADAVGADRASLFAVDGGTATLLTEYHDGGAKRAGVSEAALDPQAVSRVIASGDWWVGELAAAPRPPATSGDHATSLSGLFVPVHRNGEIRAVLGVARRHAEFRASEVVTLQDLALLCGLALTAAERFRHEREHGMELAALEDAKSRFLNLVSHELRGPLAVLNGYLSLLIEGSFGEPPAEMTHVLRILGAKANEMNGLVTDMLDTARLDENRMDLSIGRVDLCDVVRGVADDWEPLIRPGQRVSVTTEDEHVAVYADASRVRTIITNLVSNAVKYSPAGGDIVCSVTSHNGTASVEVQDHGLGIAAESLPELFSRFGRVVTPETSHIPGTGLGLYLSRELARAQGGDVAVCSEKGQGSTFTLSLPRVRGKARLVGRRDAHRRSRN